MTWKTVPDGDVGDATHFGGNDVNKISKLFSGIDVDDITILSDWKHDNFVDIKAITEPSSPVSGYVRLFIDSADGLIKIKKSNGDVVIVE